MKNSVMPRRSERSKKRVRFDLWPSKRPRKTIPADPSRLPLAGSRAARFQPLLQSGVLAFRRFDDGEIAVLLVRKPRSKNWGIPKGNAEPQLSLAENAAKEAFEEAGVRGRVDSHAVGKYRAVKRKHGLKLVIEVCVHLLEVTETAKKWPEKGEREIKWCSPQEAAILLHEPLLAELCDRLQR